MTYSQEMQFLAKFIFGPEGAADPSVCHSLVVREFALRLIPCTILRKDDVTIFRIMPQELQSGLTRNRWIDLTDRYVMIKTAMNLNDHGGKNGPEPKNTNS